MLGHQSEEKCDGKEKSIHVQRVIASRVPNSISKHVDVPDGGAFGSIWMARLRIDMGNRAG